VKIAFLCITMALLGGAGFAVYFSDGMPSRLPAPIHDLLNGRLDTAFRRTQWREGRCFFDVVKSDFKPECLEQGSAPLLFLWGDSMAASLYPGLKQLQETIHFRIAQFTRGFCPPSEHFLEDQLHGCAENNEYVLSVLAQAHPDTLVLQSNWAFYGILPTLRNLIAKLRAMGIARIVIIGPPATWRGGLPGVVVRYYMLHFYLHNPTLQLIPARSSFGVEEVQYERQREFREAVPSFGTEYISAWDAFCNGMECLTRLGGNTSDLIVFDGYHLTLAGSNYLARAIVRCLLPQPAARAAFPEGADKSRICIGGNNAGTGD
jgi:hypothetical protein